MWTSLRAGRAAGFMFVSNAQSERRGEKRVRTSRLLTASPEAAGTDGQFSLKRLTAERPLNAHVEPLLAHQHLESRLIPLRNGTSRVSKLLFRCPRTLARTWLVILPASFGQHSLWSSISATRVQSAVPSWTTA